MRNNLAALPLLCLALVTGCASQSGRAPPPLQDPTRNAGSERLPVVAVPGGLALSYGPAATRDRTPYARRIS
jgi:hypothetical protein